MSTASAFYKEHAMAYAEISDDWMTITLPSEKKADVSYEVQCARIANGVEVVSCGCRGFEYRSRQCKHMIIVQEWINEVFMSSQGICEVEAGKWYIVNSDTQCWVQNGQWVSAGPTENAIEIVKSYLEKQQEVVEEPVVEEPIVETIAQEVAVEEVAPEAAQVVETPKQMYRIITAPGAKRERFDLVGYVSQKKEMKQDMRAEIAEIKDRKRTEDGMMRAALTTNQGFRLMR